ncbi:MAG TPA: hypothetical protein VGC04_07935 [Cellulomonas sp.]
MPDHRAGVAAIVRPSSVTLGPGGLRRTPPRPAELRDPGYLDRYDDSTVFFDVFAAAGRTLAVGPPLLDLAAPLSSARATVGGRAVRVRSTELDRVQRSDLGRAAGSDLELTFAGERYRVPVGADLAGLFAGRRALMTLSLDNELAWLRDWARYHASAHGADAVVVYDNGSRSYGLDELLATLASVPGIEIAVVVDWSFPYGPQGGPGVPWDSDYAQYGALEHARRRLLREAAGFLNADVDELVLTADGSSVFEHAARAPHGVVSYTGRWVHPDPHTQGAGLPRHADSAWVDESEAVCSSKWCVVPARLTERAQLQVHDVRGAKVYTPPGLGYRHFRAVSTHWKEDRRAAVDDAGRLSVDAPLRAALDRHLPGSTTT